MQEKEIYTEIELDYYPDKESIDATMQYLESLQLMAKSLNQSSEIAIRRKHGGAGFNWKIKITAQGEWA